MDWKRRWMELTLAGGTLLSAGCPGGAFCGNANSDPCICGRPQASAVDKAACDVKKSCDAQGLPFNYDDSAPACVEPDLAMPESVVRAPMRK